MNDFTEEEKRYIQEAFPSEDFDTMKTKYDPKGISLMEFEEEIRRNEIKDEIETERKKDAKKRTAAELERKKTAKKRKTEEVDDDEEDILKYFEGGKKKSRKSRKSRKSKKTRRHRRR